MGRAAPFVVVVAAPGVPDPPGLDQLGPTEAVVVVRTAAELDAVVDAADVVVVADFRTELIAGLGTRAGQIPWIHATSAGVDAARPPAVAAGRTLVTNARGVFDAGIAEWVLAVLLAMSKDLPTTLRLQAEHRWRHRESIPQRGRRLLVVGAGSIGTEVARLCRAVGMEVVGVATRARPAPEPFARVVGTGALHDELGRADDVVVCTPLTERTRHLLDAEALAAMRPGARLVNVGRGPVVDEAALIAALQRGHLAGAALDVFDVEPLAVDSPLWDMPQVIVSPHMSGDEVGWELALARQLADNLERWRRGEELEGVL